MADDYFDFDEEEEDSGFDWGGTFNKVLDVGGKIGTSYFERQFSYGGGAADQKNKALVTQEQTKKVGGTSFNPLWIGVAVLSLVLVVLLVRRK